MTKFVICLPYIYGPYAEACFATIGDLPDTLLLPIDNTENNLGVAESWNCGIDKLREHDADWLIVVSAAIRFGEPGGLDMLEQLDNHSNTDIVHFASKDVSPEPYVRGKSPGYDEGVLGWHLTAVSRKVIEDIGYFDSNFYPLYWEDIDYDLRINKFYNHVEWLILPIDAHGESLRHSVELAGVQPNVTELIAYFAGKWGIHPNAYGKLQSYDVPFNETQNSIKFFPYAHGREGK